MSWAARALCWCAQRVYDLAWNGWVKFFKCIVMGIDHCNYWSSTRKVAFNLLRALSFIAQCQRPPFVFMDLSLSPPVVMHSVLLCALALGVRCLAGINCDQILWAAFDCCSAFLRALFGGDPLGENFMSPKLLSVVHLWCSDCGYVTLLVDAFVNKTFVTRTPCFVKYSCQSTSLCFCSGHFRIIVVLQCCCSSWDPWVFSLVNGPAFVCLAERCSGDPEPHF